MVDGMFNVNSTSVAAWHALVRRHPRAAGRSIAIRTGTSKPVEIPSGKRIALSRFNTETTDKEMDDPESGVTRARRHAGMDRRALS